ncbi:phospho-N-acetylmuramoyl-pentapeptide-transferase [Campylobacter sp. JMF_08 NE1]|uniref:phospho-N-acetylmuramoyl-pentapeptide- transferase n=1 Tax=Campylobacter sp. JMF_08 NE1 TaxID=2983821 RepID=UPI0022EA00EA|nr:phospho-N-acetylmuramoyl-pentapeptide-transferase [Campylobacter sp. JMF_08 NE1]MDA3048315.1 phospho-N-acetylmuramoyl-pentapeptide-transferase [Campylobacter sp. JMF_08 NE1]
MLYYIYQITNINFFQYTTARAGIAFFIAFILSVYLMPRFISWARAKNASQPIYDLAPQTHQKKSKTPTMGGLVFVFSAIVASALCVKFSIFTICGLITLAGFCAIGFKDDLSKILSASNHAGLSPQTKLLLQNALALGISFTLYIFSPLGGELYLPFVKNHIINLEFFAIVFWMIVFSASSNAVNLTDGLDGLATIPSVFSLASLGIFAYLCGHAIYAQYLFLPKIAGVGELSIIITALIGALFGFLWFNCYPAEVFMGDSGSLSVGAFLGYCAIVTKNEFLLIIIGFVFVMETLSVILQVGSFKMFKRRIFLMAPIHHHFELKGWSENKIIIRFWIIALMANLIALTSIKLR